jgi:hypothetical protein
MSDTKLPKETNLQATLAAKDLNSTKVESASPSTKTKSVLSISKLTIQLGLPITEKIYPKKLR